MVHASGLGNERSASGVQESFRNKIWYSLWMGERCVFLFFFSSFQRQITQSKNETIVRCVYIFCCNLRIIFSDYLLVKIIDNYQISNDWAQMGWKIITLIPSFEQSLQERNLHDKIFSFQHLKKAANQIIVSQEKKEKIFYSVPYTKKVEHLRTQKGEDHCSKSANVFSEGRPSVDYPCPRQPGDGSRGPRPAEIRQP